MPDSLPSILLEIYNNNPSISTDSRKIIEGSLFFALKGENFDGNHYAEDALKKGAAKVVVDDAAVYERNSSNTNFIYSANVLRSLQDLARAYRIQLGIPILAIGGSNGKTTTKELLLAVLSTKFKAYATPGNFNNHIGLPLTLLGIPTNAEIAIIELGTNQKGDIAELVNIGLPDFGLITNIGKEHLEGFGSMEGVAQEEGELFAFLERHGGLAFVNSDDPYLNEMARKLGRSISYGREEEAMHHAELLAAFPGATLKLDSGMEVFSRLPGAFNFSNILAAFAVARHFGIPDFATKTAIEAYSSTNSRSQIIEKSGYTFLLDCYNANPSSMELAIKSLAEYPGEKFFIVGDMLELGAYEAAEHQSVIAQLKELNLSKGIFIGPAFARELREDARSFSNAQQAAEFLKLNAPKKGTLLFLKGSRGIAVEKAVAHWL